MAVFSHGEFGICPNASRDYIGSIELTQLTKLTNFYSSNNLLLIYFSFHRSYDVI